MTTDLTEPSTLSDLVSEHPDWESAPNVQIVCPICEKHHWHNKLLASVFPNTPCDPCTGAQNARSEFEECLDTNQAQQEILDAILPPALQDTDPTRIPRHLLQQVAQWSPKQNGIGLWILGPTRSFKSRSVSLLVKKLVTIDKIKPMTFFHGAFGDELAERAKSTASVKAWKQRIARAPILVIDDLFAQKLTEFQESTLFDLLDARTHAYLPSIITTQITKKDANNLFHNPKRQDAFFARIKEFFQVVRAKQHSAP